MKTSIIIEDGMSQIALTPENDFESSLLSKINIKKMEATLYSGSYHRCQAGWTREFTEPMSLLICIEDKPEPPEIF